VTEHEVPVKENRTIAKFFAGLLIVSAFVAGSTAPAQARDTGWDLRATTTQLKLGDTGWD
jgi:hypothetical protein